ncbi:hypothetical protein A2U01_0057511, partial [Trifolium medium]|nr:hypothetical protein [Trifolium medium]
MNGYVKWIPSTRNNRSMDQLMTTANSLADVSVERRLSPLSFCVSFVPSLPESSLLPPPIRICFPRHQ